MPTEDKKIDIWIRNALFSIAVAVSMAYFTQISNKMDRITNLFIEEKRVLYEKLKEIEKRQQCDHDKIILLEEKVRLIHQDRDSYKKSNFRLKEED